MNNPIHGQMTIEELLRSFPNKRQQLIEELTHAGLHCAGCAASSWETLTDGMAGHGMHDEEIASLLQRLNNIVQNTEDLSTIRLTELAAQKFLEILAKDNKAGWGLRLGLHSSSCCGTECFLDYSQQANPDDLIFESHGVSIHVQQALAPQLLGTTIDYVEGKQGIGFKISIPSSCGCGCGHSHKCCS